METIYQTLPLNKDICNIIFKYFNITLKILVKLKDKYQKIFDNNHLEFIKKVKRIPLINILLQLTYIVHLGFDIDNLDVDDELFELFSKDPDVINGLIKIEPFNNFNCINVRLNNSDDTENLNLYLLYKLYGLELNI